MDFNKELRPVIDAIRTHRKANHLSAGEVSRAAGMSRTWATDLESGKGGLNPSVGRLALYCNGAGVQEFGVYVIIDGEYTSAALVGGDDVEDDNV